VPLIRSHRPSIASAVNGLTSLVKRSEEMGHSSLNDDEEKRPATHGCPLFGLKIEVVPWVVLEFQRAPQTVGLAADDHERSHEAQHLEFSVQFVRGPDLPMLSFERLAAPRIGVDFGEALAAEKFGFVDHGFSLHVEDGLQTSIAGVRHLLELWLEEEGGECFLRAGMRMEPWTPPTAIIWPSTGSVEVKHGGAEV